MSNSSPILAYQKAVKAYQEVLDDPDAPGFRRQLRTQGSELESCFQRLLQAGEPGQPAVWHAIGSAYSSGRGTRLDKGEAVRWLRRASEAGFTPAMVSLGIALWFPTPSASAGEAVHWFRQAAKQGDADGMVWLGFAYRDGTGVPSDCQDAVRWFIKAVEAGDSHALVHVGRIYAHYLSSPAQALPWFLRAAQAQHADSFLELARLYENPDSGVHDPAEAHRWFRVAAEHSEGGAVSALLALARQHLEGRGAACDVERARSWLRRVLLRSRKDSSSHREATRMLAALEGRFL